MTANTFDVNILFREFQILRSEQEIFCTLLKLITKTIWRISSFMETLPTLASSCRYQPFVTLHIGQVFDNFRHNLLVDRQLVLTTEEREREREGGRRFIRFQSLAQQIQWTANES